MRSYVRFLERGLSTTVLALVLISFISLIDKNGEWMDIMYGTVLIISIVSYVWIKDIIINKPVDFEEILKGKERIEKMQSTASDNLERIKIYSESMKEIYLDRMGVDHNSIIEVCKNKNQKLFKEL